MMAQFGSVCTIDENVNNRPCIRNAPARHSAVDTNGTSAQSCRHSGIRYRRRKAPEPETPNGLVLSRSASRSVGDLTLRSADELKLHVYSSNGTPPSRVDASDKTRHPHLNGYSSTKYRQKSSTADAKNAGGNNTLATASTDERTSDGTIHNDSIRTLSNGTACVSNLLHNERFPVSATNGVAVFLNQGIDRNDIVGDARNNNSVRFRTSAIEYRVPNTSVNETSVSEFPAVEYPNSSSDETISDARNGKQIVPLCESDGVLAKVGDFDREREIERRMRELGLWEYKREQERHLAALLEAEMVQRDGLTAAVRRGRRRQRGEASSAADDIRRHVNHQFIRYYDNYPLSF